MRAGERVSGTSHLSADVDRGWISRYYAQRTPALSFALQARSSSPVRFLTVVTLGGTQPVEVDESLEDLIVDSKCITISQMGSSAMRLTHCENLAHCI